MTALFPRNMLTLLRCSYDAGNLTVVQETEGNAEGLREATLRCATCSAQYRIEEGIARLLVSSLSAEDQHEMAIRDTIDYDCSTIGPFVPPSIGWRSVLSDRLEVPAHMDELRLTSGHVAMDLACGDGRYTNLMAQAGATVLAVDLSLNALRLMAARLPSGAQVGRVHADLNHFHVAPSSFDRALSSTPLDSRDERMTMYRMISNALKDDGRYIGGVEHDDLNRRLLGLPLLRRYSEGGILIEHLSSDGLRREIAPYFLKLHSFPIRPRIPLIHKLPQNVALAMLRLAAALPGIKNFGEILLFCAERPVRLPVEGHHRQGSSLAKSAYRSYVRSKHQEPSWGEERVQ
jgi:uncharacterized protein YbaR (Trm112 family)/ubiquinone/menaquinone biosynthesis C-methylase UbiE